MKWCGALEVLCALEVELDVVRGLGGVVCFALVSAGGMCCGCRRAVLGSNIGGCGMGGCGIGGCAIGDGAGLVILSQDMSELGMPLEVHGRHVKFDVSFELHAHLDFVLSFWFLICFSEFAIASRT